MSKTTALLATLISIGLLSGCGKNDVLTGPEGGSASDRAQISDVLARNPQYVDEEISQSEDPVGLARIPRGAATETALATITPLNFYRHIRHVDRTFEFAFGDTDSTGHPVSAVVTVHKHLTGTFVIVTPSDSVFGRLNRVRKPLDEQWTRRLQLVRGRGTVAGQTGWRIVAFSGVDDRSTGGSTRIASIRVQATGLDTTVTDPLGFFAVSRGLRCGRPDSATVTVTTQRNDDVVVLEGRDRRFRLHNNGDNTYTGVFRSIRIQGIHHLGITALSHGTLFDDQAAYDADSWLFPYVMGREDLASNRP